MADRKDSQTHTDPLSLFLDRSFSYDHFLRTSTDVLPKRESRRLSSGISLGSKGSLSNSGQRQPLNRAEKSDSPARPVTADVSSLEAERNKLRQQLRQEKRTAGSSAKQARSPMLKSNTTRSVAAVTPVKGDQVGLETSSASARRLSPVSRVSASMSGSVGAVRQQAQRPATAPVHKRTASKAKFMKLSRFNARLKAILLLQRWWKRRKRRNEARGRRMVPDAWADNRGGVEEMKREKRVPIGASSPTARRAHGPTRLGNEKLQALTRGFIVRFIYRSKAVQGLARQVRDTEQLLSSHQGPEDAFSAQLRTQLTTLKERIIHHFTTENRLRLHFGRDEVSSRPKSRKHTPLKAGQGRLSVSPTKSAASSPNLTLSSQSLPGAAKRSSGSGEVPADAEDSRSSYPVRARPFLKRQTQTVEPVTNKLKPDWGHVQSRVSHRLEPRTDPPPKSRSQRNNAVRRRGKKIDWKQVSSRVDTRSSYDVASAKSGKPANPQYFEASSLLDEAETRTSSSRAARPTKRRAKAAADDALSGRGERDRAAADAIANGLNDEQFLRRSTGQKMRSREGKKSKERPSSAALPSSDAATRKHSAASAAKRAALLSPLQSPHAQSRQYAELQQMWQWQQGQPLTDSDQQVPMPLLSPLPVPVAVRSSQQITELEHYAAVLTDSVERHVGTARRLHVFDRPSMPLADVRSSQTDHALPRSVLHYMAAPGYLFAACDTAAFQEQLARLRVQGTQSAVDH